MAVERRVGVEERRVGVVPDVAREGGESSGVAKLGRTELCGWQASRRGGEVRMNLAGGRVWLGGTAVTVWQGELL